MFELNADDSLDILALILSLNEKIIIIFEAYSQLLLEINEFENSAPF